jgi:hypothetical protein
MVDSVQEVQFKTEPRSMASLTALQFRILCVQYNLPHIRVGVRIYNLKYSHTLQFKENETTGTRIINFIRYFFTISTMNIRCINLLNPTGFFTYHQV